MADFETPSKRFSGMGMAGEDPPTLPVPDGTIAAYDRYHFLDLYSAEPAAAGGSKVPTYLLIGWNR